MFTVGMHTVDSLAAVVPWLRFFLTHDPLAVARRVKVPVLILQGETDRQVTAEQAPELAAAFKAGGNRDVTVHVFPRANHLFVDDPSGNPAGYASLPVHMVRSDVLAAIVDWVKKKL
jgi:dipeptidyl aminopeptidase/acylaminoacyl peptidase